MMDIMAEVIARIQSDAEKFLALRWQLGSRQRLSNLRS